MEATAYIVLSFLLLAQVALNAGRLIPGAQFSSLIILAKIAHMAACCVMTHHSVILARKSSIPMHLEYAPIIVISYACSPGNPMTLYRRAVLIV